MIHENEETHRIAITSQRSAKNQLMAESATTPLTTEQVLRFKGLDYYPIEYKQRFEGIFSTVGAGKTMTLNTTDGKSQVLTIAGSVSFEYSGKLFTLTVLRNNNLPEFANPTQKYFIPFTDLTNGSETNETGRYLPVDDPGTGNTMVVDFNRAMNPFNGYNTRLVSLLPPAINQLQMSFQSGERKFEDRLR